jgi:hypothetical protein
MMVERQARPIMTVLFEYQMKSANRLITWHFLKRHWLIPTAQNWKVECRRRSKVVNKLLRNS